MLFLTAALPALLVPQPIGRQAALKGAAAAAFLPALPAFADYGEFTKQASLGGRMFAVGSPGISAYQKLQLDNALNEFTEPTANTPADVKLVLEEFGATLPRVSTQEIDKNDLDRISKASSALVKLSTGEALETLAAKIAKGSSALDAALKKSDSKASAAAAIVMAVALTDYAYTSAALEKPLAALREAPLAYDRDKAGSVSMPVSGKTI